MGTGADGYLCELGRWDLRRSTSRLNTRSVTWTCSGTAGWSGCSTVCGRRRRWARSCGPVSFGHVRQFDAVASRLLIALATAAPLLSGADQVAYLDIDDTIRETHGYAKPGAGYGYSGAKGLNALVATASTPLSAPVIAATRLRKGATNSTKGAFRLISDALATLRQTGAGAGAGAGVGVGVGGMV